MAAIAQVKTTREFMAIRLTRSTDTATQTKKQAKKMKGLNFEGEQCFVPKYTSAERLRERSNCTRCTCRLRVRVYVCSTDTCVRHGSNVNLEPRYTDNRCDGYVLRVLPRSRESEIVASQTPVKNCQNHKADQYSGWSQLRKLWIEIQMELSMDVCTNLHHCQVVSQEVGGR